MSVHLLPTRKVNVIRHRFQTSQLQMDFLSWVDKADLGSRVGLCLVGLLEGKETLAAKMDAIAERRLAFGRTVMEAMKAAFEEGLDEVYIPGDKMPY